MKLSKKVTDFTFNCGMTYYATIAVIKWGFAVQTILFPPEIHYLDYSAYKRDEKFPTEWKKEIPNLLDEYFKAKADSAYHLKLDKKDFPNLHRP